MSKAIQRYLNPVITMNRRILIGGFVLALVLATESLLALTRTMA